ncbi:hypothetical protein FKM82_024044 [Ascaphus truei]
MVRLKACPNIRHGQSFAAPFRAEVGPQCTVLHNLTPSLPMDPLTHCKDYKPSQECLGYITKNGLFYRPMQCIAPQEVKGLRSMNH